MASLSQSDLTRLNQNKRRLLHPENTKDELAKRNRAAGQAYTSKKSKAAVPALQPPQDPKVCARCDKVGCLIAGTVKRRLFDQFRSVDYDSQSAILLGCIEIIEPRQRTVLPRPSSKKNTYLYCVTVEGAKLPVCRATLLDIFKISKDRLSRLAKKMERGELSPRNQQGKHLNRPHRVSEDVRDKVRRHIRSFPTYESHYTRKEGNPLRQYLDPALNRSKMYQLFIEQQTLMRGEVCNQWIYSDIFNREFPALILANPKADTCDQCDTLQARFNDATESEKVQIQPAREMAHQGEVGV